MKQIQWQRRTEVPLIVAAVIYLVAYSVQVTMQPEPAAGRVLEGVIWGVWASSSSITS